MPGRRPRSTCSLPSTSTCSSPLSRATQPGGIWRQRCPSGARPAYGCSAASASSIQHSLDDYRAHGGYQALRRAFELGPEGIIREVVDSKLLGRGGAAFPTGRKWDAVARQPVQPHYLVCNADESEPGTFKDRVLLEGDPFSVIEAMTIAGYATNCIRGYLYLRGEYPQALETVERALEQARAHGFLGEDILGRGFAFDIEIRKGAGAYICGEETAIFNSIEGERGEPRNKPPFPVVSGLFGKPTVVNNVETLANVLDIVLEGGPAFATIGTEGSTGTKLFCLSGHVARPGVYEVPFGATIRDLLELAGGVPGGRSLQTVLVGGAAGGFIRPDELDVPLTFEDARAANVFLGSGVIMALDDTVDLPSHADAHRGILPRRVLRPVRPLPGGNGAAGGGARATPLGRDEGVGRGRARPHRRARAGDARRVDLRARTDRIERYRVGDRTPRRLQREVT